MLTDQPVSLVSDVAGTNNRSCEQNYGNLPLGPVVITDTAGIDDTTEFRYIAYGENRRGWRRLTLAVYVLRTDEEPTADDMHWLGAFKTKNNVLLHLIIQWN